MLTGRIHSTESCGTVDGQGIRFIIFVQGCLMRCKYCHNRDTWDREAGREVTVEEMMAEIRPYKHFFKASGGGLTVSGGEALLQKEFVTELFKACKAEGINTCLDTNGFIRDYDHKIDDLLAVTDLVILDLKQMSENAHINLTKVSNKYAIKFALYLHKKKHPTWIRYVVVPTYSDDLGSAALLAQFIRHMENVERLELLPYHEIGTYKWEQYGEPYELSHISPPTKGSMESLANLFRAYKINVIY